MSIEERGVFNIYKLHRYDHSTHSYIRAFLLSTGRVANNSVDVMMHRISSDLWSPTFLHS